MIYCLRTVLQKTGLDISIASTRDLRSETFGGSPDQRPRSHIVGKTQDPKVGT